jgi:SET domain-containing protein
MMLVPAEVAASPIDGLGVFATAPIEAGTLVWALSPGLDAVIPEGAWPGLHLEGAQEAFLARYAYYDAKKRAFVLCCDDARFMNHADDPNVSDTIDDRCFALRDIAAGEELTCNYHRLDIRPMRFQPR